MSVENIFSFYNLNSEDIEYITTIINLESFGKFKTAEFLTYMNYSGICKFCTFFSDEVIKCIVNRDTIRLLEYINDCSEIFDSIYSVLNDREAKSLKDTIMKEYLAMISYLYDGGVKSCYDCYNDICLQELVENSSNLSYRPTYKNQLYIVGKEKQVGCYDIYEFLYDVIYNSEVLSKYKIDRDIFSSIVRKYILELKLIKYSNDKFERR